MRIAVLGDIHGNKFALRAALDGAAREGAERLLITGDLVGYYYWPAQVLEMLEPWPRWTISGNHERMLAEARRNEQALHRAVAKYGSGLAVAIQELTAGQADDLVALPPTLRLLVGSLRIMVAHGTPWDADEYLYPDAQADRWQALTRCDADVVVLGHTHYRFIRTVEGTLVINPGSVGQPRDRIPGAPWVLLDTQTRLAVQFNEPYDALELIAHAKARDPDMQYLHEVLCRTALS